MTDIEAIAIRCAVRRRLMTPGVPDNEYEAMLIEEEADFDALAKLPARDHGELRLKEQSLKAVPDCGCTAAVAMRDSIMGDIARL